MADSGQYSEANLAARRRLAAAMLERGMDTSPISSPWQGLARMAQAGIGGYGIHQAEEKGLELEKADKARDAAAWADLPGLDTAPTTNASPQITDGPHSSITTGAPEPSPAGPAPIFSPEESQQIKTLLSNPATRQAGLTLYTEKRKAATPAYEFKSTKHGMYRVDPRKGTAELIPGVAGEGDGADDVEYGVTPFYAKDEAGQTQAYVMGKNGKPRKVELDPGAQPLGPGGIAEAREFGKQTGGAKANLPKVEEYAASMTEKLDNLITDPNIGRMSGMVQGRLPNITGTANTMQAKIDQVQGQAFLQAYESLKGAGQITEIEGRKATEAITRLANMKQDDEGYMEALKDAKREIKLLVGVAQKKAAADGSAPSAARGGGGAAPETKTINGVKYVKEGGQWYAQ